MRPFAPYGPELTIGYLKRGDQAIRTKFRLDGNTASGKVFAPPGGCSLGVVAVAVFCFFVVVFYRLALLLTRKSRYAAAMQI